MTGEIDLLNLVIHASWFVKLVMIALLLFSFLSWMIIFRKHTMLKGALGSANEFEERFWSGADLAALFREVTGRGDQISGIESIFESGFREFARLRQRRGLDPRTMLEGAQRAMRVAQARELDRLEANLEFLANVGSISPYVGLLGTVWGIMSAFQGLATVKEATIAMVAPGISEALVATAMGLVAAIPASWAYNRYSNKVDRVANRFDTFTEEFSSILQRQAHIDE
ncbi:protein TolQ [Tahibacter amnicola]|uniref:Tol-Pal system protein TolQ n=1 Tax=Tahibacter amnicola TaxID=2976241 RepID=A0ABY6BEY6_9GAMM|nr:protein TolQ [Tahibacter amnicola]UXI67670.1 protein TolQ [Tahibacter amnicola]